MSVNVFVAAIADSFSESIFFRLSPQEIPFEDVMDLKIIPATTDFAWLAFNGSVLLQ